MRLRGRLVRFVTIRPDMSAELWTRIYLVRHGTVAPTWHGRIYGDLDVPLSAAGQDEARAVAELLRERPLSRVVSSGLSRAQFGAEAIGRARAKPLEVRVDPRWREISRGTWAGLTFQELEDRDPGAWERWSADPAEVRPPGGESLGDLLARVLPAARELVRECPGQEVAVVAHGWTLRTLVAAALGWDLAACARLVMPPASLCALDWCAEEDPVGGPHGGGVAPHQSPPPIRARLLGLGLDAVPPRDR